MPRGRPRNSRGCSRGRGRGRGSSNQGIATASVNLSSISNDDTKDIRADLGSRKEETRAVSPQKAPLTERQRMIENEILKAKAELKKLENGTHPKFKKLDDSYANQRARIQRWNLEERQLIDKDTDEQMKMIKSKYESDRELLRSKLVEELEQEHNQIKKAWSVVVKKADINKWESDYIELMMPERSLRSRKSSCSCSQSLSTNEDSENTVVPVIADEEFGPDLDLSLLEKNGNEVSFAFTAEEITEGMAAINAFKS